MSRFGREFYRQQVPDGRSVTLKRTVGKKVDEVWVKGAESVVPFWAGRELRWEIVKDLSDCT